MCLVKMATHMVIYWKKHGKYGDLLEKYGIFWGIHPI
jgi:hypothetical protein